MKRTLIASLVLAGIAVVPVVANAQSGGMQGMEMKGMEMKKGETAKDTKTHKGVGEVKSVDAKKGTVKLAHGPIQSMKWDSMTMTFKAQDPKMFETLSPGKKVEFTFVQKGRDYIITELK